MDCGEEVSLLRRELSRRKGVFDLSFDVLRSKMEVEYDPGRITTEEIEQAVAAAGMRCAPWNEEAEQRPTFWRRRGRQVMAAASGTFLAAGTLIQGIEKGDLIHALFVHEGHHHSMAPWAVPFLVLAIVGGIWFSLPKALASLRLKRADMNVLMAVSILGAGFLGEWIEGATVAFLFSVANLLEGWTVARARRAIGSLIGSTPTQASLVHGDHEHRLRVDKVPVGSIIRVKPGEMIPIDGGVVRGRSGVDQSLLSGESVPVLKTEGSQVYAGTMNRDGSLDIRTTRPATDTTVARILRMVEASQRRRAPSEQLVERFARVYTPAMIALAAAVAIVPPAALGGDWASWFYQGMVILLISCPCALVVSTPVSIASALASAARRGVLVKGGMYLETAARIQAVALDKTGVLTEGTLEVQSFRPLDSRPPEQVLAAIAGLEAGSEHPLARAILRYARSQGVRPAALEDFQVLEGKGAEARIGGKRFWAGSTRLLEERCGGAEELRPLLAEFEDAEHTVVVCGVEQEPWALVGLVDSPRPEARRAVEELRAAGIKRVVMLTGDNPVTAQAIGKAVGVDAVHAELLPEDKARVVGELAAAHGRVAMVGDGINDAQAMAESSLGVAFGRRSTDLALETADVVILADSLERLPFLVRHGRRMLSIIRQNIVAAVALKAAFLAAAGLGVATLWMAVAADMGATFLVSLNGLRLLRPAATSSPRRP